MELNKPVTLSFAALSGGLILLFFFTACSKKIAADKLPASQLVFGNGGGFAGFEKEFVLAENGHIWEKQRDGKLYKPVAKINKNEAAARFLQYDSLGIRQMDFKQPGNLYYYISMRRNGAENKIVWGDANKPVRDDIAQFYQLLANYLNK